MTAVPMRKVNNERVKYPLLPLLADPKTVLIILSPSHAGIHIAAPVVIALPP
jgi:hypothetical protein